MGANYVTHHYKNDSINFICRDSEKSKGYNISLKRIIAPMSKTFLGIRAEGENVLKPGITRLRLPSIKEL